MTVKRLETEILALTKAEKAAPGKERNKVLQHLEGLQVL